MKSSSFEILSLTSLAVSFVLGLADFGYSATNTVTSLAPSGSGSLREAIDYATSGDTINFAVTGTINLRWSTEFWVGKDVSILGPGASVLTITGYHTNRIFSIGNNVTVLISDLTLQDGQARNGTNGVFIYPSTYIDGGPGEPGGAITNGGSLTLRNCVLSGNHAGTGGQGASDYYGFGHTAGGAGGSGGTIYSLGSLSISNCTFTHNASGKGGDGGVSTRASSSGGAGGSGGAIYSAGPLEVEACTFSGNTNGSAGITPGSAHQGSSSEGGSGGAIWSSGVLNARSCTFSGNSSGSYAGSGGAIWSGGILNAWGCTFTGNSTGSGASGVSGETCGGGGRGGYGGAICGLSTLSLTNCFLAGNWSGNGGAGGFWEGGMGAWCPGGCGGDGGGIYCASTLTLLGCTIITNRTGLGGRGGSPGGGGGAGGNGGAIFCGGPLRATNSTLAANTCGNGGAGGGYSFDPDPGGQGGAGGAIYCNFGVTNITLISCTVVSNSIGLGGYSPSGIQAGNGMGAGVCLSSPGGTFLDNIVALGIGRTQDVSGAFHSLGHNLVGATNGSSGFTGAGDLVGSAAAPLDPLVGPLANNGGPTLTMTLLPGSPAIDAGSAWGAPTTDQRGIARPMGAAVDIGAFEFISGVPTLSITCFGVASLQVRGIGSPGQTCRLLASVELANWVPIETNQFGVDGTVLFQETWNAASPSRFYRLVTP